MSCAQAFARVSVTKCSCLLPGHPDYVWRPSSLFAAAAVLLSSCLFHPWQQCCVSLPGLFRLPHALLPRPLESLELGFTGVVHVVALGVPTLNVLHLGWLPGPSLASLAHVCDRSDFFSCVCTVYWSVCLSAADCPASFPSELVYYWTSSPPRTVGKNHASTVLPLRCGPRSRWTPPNRRGPCCFY